MDLNYKTFGQGHPLLILHGLFGTLDNWQTLGKELSEDYMVYLVDQRNHGRSPHLDEMNYPAMAGDLKQFMEDNWIYEAHVLGHSMGGKAAMQLALQHPDTIDRLIVVDIAPRRYPRSHEEIFDALRSLQLNDIDSRGDANEALRAAIKDEDIRHFLLKNLRRTKEGGYAWKMNLAALYEHYDDILASIEDHDPFEGPALFIRGGRSNYVQEQDYAVIEQLFPQARIETVEGAGHWIHVDAREAMLRLIRDFLE